MNLLDIPSLCPPTFRRGNGRNIYECRIEVTKDILIIYDVFSAKIGEN